MGITTRPRKAPSHTAYFVALGGIVVLFLLLCCYFLYFCFKRVKELYQHPELLEQPISSYSSPAKSTYPVNPGVRDTAEAMAKLCKLPAAPTKGDTVFPTSTSPAMQRADTGENQTISEDITDKSECEVSEKAPATSSNDDNVSTSAGHTGKVKFFDDVANKVNISIENADEKVQMSIDGYGKVKMSNESDEKVILTTASN